MRPSPCHPNRSQKSARSTTGHCQIWWSRPADVSSSRAMASARRSVSRRSAVTSPTIRMPRLGPGKGWRATMSSGSRVLVRPHGLVLEQQPQRFDERKLQVSRQSTDIWWLLMFAVRCRHGFHDVGIQRALDQELDVPFGAPQRITHCASSNARIEFAADDLALAFRFGHPRQCFQETVGHVDRDEVGAGGGDEVPLHLGALTARSRPWSTNTHVSRSPTARWTSAAATGGSPRRPDSPQMARPSPICVRTCSTRASAMLAGVHVASMPANSCRKRLSTCWPCGLCMTSGGTGHRPAHAPDSQTQRQEHRNWWRRRRIRREPR